MSETEALKTELSGDTLHLTAEIVAAFVSNNSIDGDKIPDLLRNVHATVQTLADAPLKEPEEPQKPAVPIKKSITPDYLICLEDGKKLKMLKRYLRTQYDMSPDDYRRKWNLPADYPMVAPNYAARRSEFAKQIGLGRIAGGKAAKKTRSRKAS
ncbi:MAG: MucR family transcriptional regulator [Pseudomonadota bacterium]